MLATGTLVGYLALCGARARCALRQDEGFSVRQDGHNSEEWCAAAAELADQAALDVGSSSLPAWEGPASHACWDACDVVLSAGGL